MEGGFFSIGNSALFSRFALQDRQFQGFQDFIEDQTFLWPELKQNNHQLYKTVISRIFFPYILVPEQILFPKLSLFDTIFLSIVHLRSVSLVKPLIKLHFQTAVPLPPVVSTQASTYQKPGSQEAREPLPFTQGRKAINFTPCCSYSFSVHYHLSFWQRGYSPNVELFCLCRVFPWLLLFWPLFLQQRNTFLIVHSSSVFLEECCTPQCFCWSLG